jgi:DNA-binding NtrC family response regulator
MAPSRTTGSRRVVVLADDLIWSTRLADALRSVGGEVRSARTAAALDALLPEVDRVVVDLTARAYDGVAAISAARAAGRRVLAVGQHDDLDLRRRALAAGAERVYAYRKLFEDGPSVLGAWLGSNGGAESHEVERA